MLCFRILLQFFTTSIIMLPNNKTNTIRNKKVMLLNLKLDMYNLVSICESTSNALAHTHTVIKTFVFVGYKPWPNIDV